MRVTVHEHHGGPLFDGRASVAVHAFCDEAEEEIGQHGVNVIRTELGSVLKHPTGYYQSRIQADRVAGNSVVNDGGVIYGPWLEGVGSRNRSTRFKGYFTFRRMTQRLQREAAAIAAKSLPRFVRRMG